MICIQTHQSPPAETAGDDLHPAAFYMASRFCSDFIIVTGILTEAVV